MRRNLTLLLAGALTALAVACQESTVAPARTPNAVSPSAAALSFSRSGHGRSQVTRSVIGSFDISPDGGTYHVGEFDIVIPAGAVCDPQASSYGARHWNEECAPANRPITVTVVAESRHDRVKVDFQPDLRFRPSAGWVKIQSAAFSDLLTSDGARSLSPDSPFFQSFSILYAPSNGSAVDEMRTLRDRTLLTHVDLSTGLVWRRVKHFSGYMVGSGYSCTQSQSTDPSQPCSNNGASIDPIGGVVAGVQLFGGGIDLNFPTVVVDP